MAYNENISINIPTDARSRNDAPYFQHFRFIKYCKANKVEVSHSSLEAYEKRKLLFPCKRILYPREMLRKRCRAQYILRKQKYEVPDKWRALIDFRDSVYNSFGWMGRSFNERLENGHPFENDLAEDVQSFVLNPEKQRFKAWKRYKVIIDDVKRIKESRAEHYYSPWKIFFVQELNQQNTDTHNRATGTKTGWGIIDKHFIKESTLNEFVVFFEKVSLFSYRRNLHQISLDRKTQKTEANWNAADRKLEKVARNYFEEFPYKKWIRFLRKLIEVYEKCKASEKILLSLEAETYAARTVGFLRFATSYDFEKICNDVSGPFKNSLSRGSEDGVDIYQGTLETLFMDEKRDLERNIKRMLDENLKELNGTLIAQERIPEGLSLQLFDELTEEPQHTALAAIQKINRAYWGQKLWREYDIWSGIKDLAISIEGHGKLWFRGRKKLDRIFSNSFGSDYSELKASAGINLDAKDTDEFICKLKGLIKSEDIPENRRCGKHLLIAGLTRNFSVHNLGGFGKTSPEVSPTYIALVRTLFVMYAQYREMECRLKKTEN